MHSKIFTLSFTASALIALGLFGPLGAAPANAQFSTTATVNGTDGPWDPVLNSGFGYGDGAQTGPALVPSGGDFGTGRVFILNYSGGKTSTDGVNFVDANGYTVFPPLTSNAPGAYIPSPGPYLNEVVGTFADPSGVITGTPFIVGNGPALLFSPGGSASQLQLGVNDNHYADNTGAVTMSVTQLPVTNWTGNAADHDFGNSGNWNNGLVTGTIEGIIDGNVDNSPVQGTGIVLGANLGDTTALALINGATLNDNITVGDSGTGAFDNNNSTHNVSGNLILGNQSTGSGIYTIEGNSANTSITFVPGGNGADPSNPNGALIVGNAGTGVFTQGNGTDTPTVYVQGDLVLGVQTNSQGTYTLNSGTLTVIGQVSVGGQSTGNNQFIQNGGTLNVNAPNTDQNDPNYAGVGSTLGGCAPSGTSCPFVGALAVGGGMGTGDYTNIGGTGTYTLNNGTINAYNVLVGGSGTGTMSQYAGAVNTTYFTLGFNSGTNGTYNQYGGEVSASGGLTVGYDGNGTYNQTGGTLVVGTSGGDPDMLVGTLAGSVGVYNLSGSSTATVNGNLIIARDGPDCCGTPASQGMVSVGTIANPSDTSSLGVTGDAVVGSGGTGQLNLYSGSVNVSGNFYVGGGGGAAGGGVYPDGGTGTVTMSGGALTASGIEVGHAGVGEFDQSGGAVTANNSLWLGNATGSNGTYNFSNGTINAGSEDIGLFGNGQFVQTGGVNTITNELDVGFESGNGTFSLSHGSVTSVTTIIGDGTGNGCCGINFGGSGTLNVSGDGTLTTGAMTVGIFAQGTVNQSGGTVAATSLTIATAGSSIQPVDTYNLTGTGILNVSGDEIVGVEGNGNFVQGTLGDGGATHNNVTGTLFVGDAFDGLVTPDGAANIREGSYTLNTGALTTAETDVGTTSIGTFTQNGGTHTTNTLVIGDQILPTAPGCFDGTNFDCTTGGPAQGTYTMNGGTLNVNDNMTVGDAGNGNLIIHSGATITVTNTTQVGVNGIGTVIQEGGSFTTGVLDLSTPAGSGSSSYTMSGGSLETLADLNVGQGGAGPATFTQSGGAVQVDGTLYDGNFAANASYTLGGTGQLSIQSGDIIVGKNATTSGTFNYNTLSGDKGTLSFNSTNQTLVVGDSGTGIFNEGSASNATDLNLRTNGVTLDIGRSVGGNGTFNLAAGSTLEDDLIVGDGGTGTFNNNAGTNTVGTSGTPANLVIGNQTTGIGTYNNNGGSNTVNGNLIVGNAGTGTYNLGNGVSGATLGVLGSGLSGGNVYIGVTGTGTVTASDGAVATVDAILVLGGPSPGETSGNGTLTVTGAGTRWTDLGQTEVGGAGTGTLDVLAGGYLESHYGASGTGTAGSFGVSAGSTGTALVDGAGSEWNLADGALRVGATSTGSGNGPEGNLLTISNGGNVIDNPGLVKAGDLTDDAAAGTVGFKSGSVGTVDVTTGGTWTNNGDLVVGDAGTGTFQQGLTNNSDNASGNTTSVTSNLIVGNLSGGSGTVTINNGTLNIGTNTANEAGGSYSTPQDSLIVGMGGIGAFTQNGGNVTVGADTLASSTNPAVQDLILGENGGSTGSYKLTAGILTVYGNANENNSAIEVGFINGNTLTDGGAGKLVQTGGSVVTYGLNGLAIGDCACGVAGNEYDISAGSLTLLANPTVSTNPFDSSSSGNLFVGAHEGGTLLQTGGSVSVAGDAFVGFANGASGQYTVNASAGNGAPSVQVGGNMFVGGTTAVFGVDTKGIGEVDQAAGDVNVAGVLDVGAGAGSTGIYNLTGGTLEDDLIVGDAGTGTFTNSGGTHTVSGNLIAGNQSTGIGTYTLGGTGNLTLATAGAQVTLGNAAGAQGTFYYNTTAGDTGSITFDSGTGQQIVVGNNGIGTFKQGAGTLDLTTPGVGLDIAAQSGSQGFYTLSGGTLKDSSLSVGDGGTGTFTNTGGIHTVTGNLTLGNLATGNGTYDLSGTGQLGVSGNLVVGNLGVGSYQQTGGTAHVNGNLTNNAGGLVEVASASFTADGNATNNSTISITSGANFKVNGSGTTTNNGTITVQNSTATFGGTFINNGSYISDPSTSYFNDLVNNGTLSGGAGDIFDVQGNFLNTGTEDTSAAELEFSTGASTDHQVTDSFAPPGGTGFAWGDLDLDAGNTLHVLSDLYIADIDGFDISGGEVLNVYSFFDIFYDPTASGFAGQYLLQGGGCLTPEGTPVGSCDNGNGGGGGGGGGNVPEPLTILIFGSGLAALASQRRKLMGKREPLAEAG